MQNCAYTVLILILTVNTANVTYCYAVHNSIILQYSVYCIGDNISLGCSATP